MHSGIGAQCTAFNMNSIHGPEAAQSGLPLRDVRLLNRNSQQHRSARPGVTSNQATTAKVGEVRSCLLVGLVLEPHRFRA
jgi:hypothetical protein